MTASTIARPPRLAASRIVRHLTPGAIAADAWVSTQAVFRSAAGADEQWRPPVLVAAGEPPYDGVVTTGVLLVVEFETRLAARWRGRGIPAIWAPCAAGVLVLAGRNREVVAPTGMLSVPGYPSLSLPAELLARPAGEGIVLDLHA